MVNEDFASRSKQISWLVTRLKRSVMDNEIARANECITLMNVLLMPKSYVCVADKELHHVIICEKEFDSSPKGFPRFPGDSIQLAHSIDVRWFFRPSDGSWRVVKDRTGDYQKRGIIKCGGIPERVTVQPDLPT